MQYVGRALGSVSKTWNSINPSTLSGAIDVVVVEREPGELHCSAFHIRFGKLALLRPTHKAVDFWVNNTKVPVHMKLGDGGEAFFVFETEAEVPANMLTSPVMSPANSPASEPQSDEEVEYLALDSESPPSSQAENSVEPFSDENPESIGLEHTEDWIKQKDPERLDELLARLSEVKLPSTTNDNGEIIIDMTGYKPGGQDSVELEGVMRQILSHDLAHPSETQGLDNDHFVDDDNTSTSKGPYSPVSLPAVSPPSSPAMKGTSPPGSPNSARSPPSIRSHTTKHYVKTLRLTSDMLKQLNLKPGQNTMKFKVRDSKATVTASIYYWKADTPVVVSDIDGTITRSDALGHVMTMIGRDWTHQGVGRLFTDIARNGYNIMYLTSRAVGQADITRGYLKSIDQDGFTLPAGPVILSPDRTMAALHREVIMRKPEIFKIACLRDIAKLYSTEGTPFYAGFGNRITDALSYRSVGVPSTKIFTINSSSEVHMELLELTGYKSSYLHITDLVDHFFPPHNIKTTLGRTDTTEFTDVNFWKLPLPPLSDEDTDSDSAAVAFSGKVDATFGSDADDSNDPDYEEDAGDEDDSGEYHDEEGEGSYEDDEGEDSDDSVFVDTSSSTIPEFEPLMDHPPRQTRLSR